MNHILRDLTVRDNAGPGITLFRGVDGNTLERNTLVRNGSAAIALTEAGHNRIVRNRIIDNDEGVLLIAGAHDNLVRENRVIGNERFGIAVGFNPSAPFSDDSNRITTNAVVANGTDGILVATAGRANVVERNRSRLNGDDGIDVNCFESTCAPGQVTLERNAANRNGDLGIEADPGAEDAGGNRARGNGNRAQCVGVSCS